jgi:hypothetical protein
VDERQAGASGNLDAWEEPRQRHRPVSCCGRFGTPNSGNTPPLFRFTEVKEVPPIPAKEEMKLTAFQKVA